MNIELIPTDISYAEDWLIDRQEAVTVKFNPLIPSTVEMLRERLLKAGSNLADYKTKDEFIWLAKLDDEIVGRVTMQNINRMMLTAEIGYGVSPHARGRGIATLAVKALAKNVFEQTPIRKLVAFIHEGNVASQRVVENVGFKKEGILREHYLVNGEVTDQGIYGLLKKEFILE